MDPTVWDFGCWHDHSSSLWNDRKSIIGWMEKAATRFHFPRGRSYSMWWQNFKVKPKYDEMLRTSHTSSIFFGAWSHFIKTLSRLTPPQPTVYIHEPLSKLWWLRQQTTACYGFPATNSFWNNRYACWKDSQTKKRSKLLENLHGCKSTITHGGQQRNPICFQDNLLTERLEVDAK